MNIDWKVIKEKYPKSYKNFMYKLKAIYLKENRIFNEPCYCDLETFFNDNNINIEISFNSALKCYSYRLLEFEYYISSGRNQISVHELYYDKTLTKKETKEQAIYKAFEIMEGKLK